MSIYAFLLTVVSRIYALFVAKTTSVSQSWQCQNFDSTWYGHTTHSKETFDSPIIQEKAKNSRSAYVLINMSLFIFNMSNIRTRKKIRTYH